MCIRCMLPNLGRWMQPRVSQINIILLLQRAQAHPHLMLLHTLLFLIVNAGGNYAISLTNAKRGIEAEALLTNLVAISTRNHGSHHRITKSVEHTLQWVISSNAKPEIADGTSPLSYIMDKMALKLSKP